MHFDSMSRVAIRRSGAVCGTTASIWNEAANDRVQRTARSCAVLWNDELADELVILSMSANPEPVDSARNREPECPEIETNPDTVKLAVADRLEMQ